MEKNNNRNLSRSQLTIIGFSFVFIGLFVLSGIFLSSKKEEIYEQKNMLLAQNKSDNEKDDDTNENEVSEQEIEVPSVDRVEDDGVVEAPVDPDSYIGTLQIPKIGLHRGFVDPSSKLNNVDQNVTIIGGSMFPDIDKSNFILAAHSGPASYAYFDKLEKLVKNDPIYVTYKNKRYTYQLVDIYTQAKTGTAAIYRNKNKKVLTLITCTNNSTRENTIYIAELIKEENIE